MNRKYSKNKQQGVALAIGMILLLTISVIGITSMKSALLEDKMAASLKNRELSDAAAQSMLVAGEYWIFKYFKENNSAAFTSSCEFCYETRSIDAFLFRTEKGFSNGYVSPQGNSINSAFGGVLAEEPRFYIEFLNGSNGDYGSVTGEAEDGYNGFKRELKIFRVIAKATDSTGHMYSGYESTFGAEDGN
jgi:type IV pilus assembly protein PilX